MKLIVLALLLLAGCSVTDSSGTRHTLALGVGVLSVRQTNNVMVYKMQMLGFGAGNMPGLNCTLGYGSSLGVSAATNTLVEISQKPFSPIIVTQP